MPELKRNFAGGKMNKDLDERILPKGEYRDALNVEVFTSEGSNVGSLQTLKGNTAVTALFGSNSSCIGNIVDNKTNRLYWLVSSTDENTVAGTVAYRHVVYSDYIMEYDESSDETSYIVVEHYKVEANAASTSTATPGGDTAKYVVINHMGGGVNPLHCGVQVGMVMTHYTLDGNNQPHDTQIRSIVSMDYLNGGWTLGLNADLDFDITSGDTITFELPYNKRALGFSYFSNVKPQKLITGINIIDKLLFWTDGLTEPKKINIERCRYGSQQMDPSTYPNGTRALPTMLVVNGDKPNSLNGRLATTSASPLPLTYRETTVIRKSPTTPLRLTMSNTTRSDFGDAGNADGLTNVNTYISLPLINQGAVNTSSEFFFVPNTSDLLSYGASTPIIATDDIMDWVDGDIVEFYSADDDSGNDSDVLVTAIVRPDPNNLGNSFFFEVMSISTTVAKVFTEFRVKLKEEDPLFEFKFPRFAYRWKYEDGEYSCYSPFSEVAFIPDEFDYLPKKGYNLGMTNNLRYLLLSGFKPTTTPLDVVEIDILYKDSTSPNVYTVETIKSPSIYNEKLETSSHDGDMGWFGKIQLNAIGAVEAPNTLDTENISPFTSHPTGWLPVAKTNFFDGTHTSGAGYRLTDSFGDINIKVGDELISQYIQGTWGTLLVSSIYNSSGITYISLTENGSATTNTISLSGLPISVVHGLTFYRESAKLPALYLDHPQGSLQVKTDMIHAAVPANQMLRPWDNVPISALAQEVTGNRVVYGNYTQNYDLYNKYSDDKIKNIISVGVTGRRNIRDNVRYDHNTTLRSPGGATVEWFSLLNNIIPEVSMPERSLKSLRDYQVGVVYMDEYGRQTPIQTHEDAVLKINKDKSNDYNAFRFHLWSNYSNGIARYPDWATHYKYYVKDTSNEYYNLAMDRFYAAEDGNVWLSFPSSERNKVDEETFLILKKQHDSDVFVENEARYKILSISNEVPLFIKTKIDSYGIKAATFQTSGEPRYQAQHVDVNNTLFDQGGFNEWTNDKEKMVRIHNANSSSYWYDVMSVVNLGSFRRLTLRKSFGVDVGFTTTDGTNSGTINPGLSIEVATKKVKNIPEFEGRFFVKILKDGVLEEHILTKAPEKTFITTSALRLGRMGNVPDNYQEWGDGAGDVSDYFGKRWYVSQEEPYDAETAGGDGWPDGSFSSGESMSGIGNDFIEMLYHDGGSGLGGGNGVWEIGVTRHGNSMGASGANLDVAKRARTSGQLFRFRGDTTIYQIRSGSREWGMRNYNQLSSSSDSEWATNHSVGIRFEFDPPLGSTGPDAVGVNGSGYDPRNGSLESTSAQSTSPPSNDGVGWQDASGLGWANGNLNNEDYHRTIEFVEEFIGDASYSSDNPAIWETEPKESVDIDIYHEASQAYPIGDEFTPYLNKFIKRYFGTSWNASNYYNCFSFANGVESNRIRDDYNAPTIDKGPKVSTVLAEQYKQENRKSGLIFSGIYNSTSGINRLNQFIQAEKITKDLNPTYGSVQKLHSRDSDLIALCEDKILQIYANKDALYNADGNVNLTASDRVLGDVRPFVGEYGISTNPESFASESYRSYFTDKSRGAVMRLSKDGLTPISEHGMKDWFRDTFALDATALIGGYDSVKNTYNLSIPSIQGITTFNTIVVQGDPPYSYVEAVTTGSYTGNTISFSEKTKGWTSFKSWVQECSCSLNNKYFTFYNAELYQHHSNDTRNNFYGTQYESSVCLIFNDIPDGVKSFSSLNYEGSQSKIVQNTTDGEYYNNATVAGWYTDSITTDLETGFIPEFKDKEGKWFNYIHGNKENTLANLDTSQFSTQGIGKPKSGGVSSTATSTSQKTMTIKDIPDND